MCIHSLFIVDFYVFLAFSSCYFVIFKDFIKETAITITTTVLPVFNFDSIVIASFLCFKETLL